MNRLKLMGICVLISTLALSGCVARTYNLTRYRVDQELSLTSGNRGYILGHAPEPQARKTTRTTRVFEVELGQMNKTKISRPATAAAEPAVPLASESTAKPETAQEEISPEIQPEEINLGFQNYTVAKNDTLQKISLKFYGTTKRWMQLYEANKNVLRGPDKLYAGQTLNIPSGSKVSAPRQKMREPKENLK